MRFSNLTDWLNWQEQLHPQAIELGLERVKQVWLRLCVSLDNLPIISIAGTNGKGSSVAMLQSIYLSAGYAVGSYTSPHLYHYNERICINAQPVDDALLMQAFERIDQARAEISLTYFEFGTLAALLIFAEQMQTAQALDIILLEVGLGGRLDAVNIIDADVAVITSIALDHQAWLGDSREAIAQEKAGIMRAHKACVISDAQAPLLIDELAQQLGCQCYRLATDFSYHCEQGQWTWQGPQSQITGLPIPALTGKQQLQNAAGALMCIELLKGRLPVNRQALREGLLNTSLAGRFEIRANTVTTVLDVAHNPAAASALANSVKIMSQGRQVYTLFSVLADKDISGVIAPILAISQDWSVAPLNVPRSASMASMKNHLLELNPAVHIDEFKALSAAYRALQQRANAGDIILVYGSFYTVAEIGRLAV